MTDLLSRFELAVAELRALGIVLTRLPGEYCVNYRNGRDDTARFAEDIVEAVALGRELAIAVTERPRPPASRRRRLHAMNPKAMRRRFIRRHNRRLRARELSQPREELPR